MGGTTTTVRRTRVQPMRGTTQGTTGVQRWLDRQFTRIAVLPTTAMMLLVFGVPLLFSLYLSFEGWSPDQALFAGNFTGIGNYQDLLTDPQFIKSLSVTFIYTATTVATELGFGLAIALLLNIDLPWIGLFRTALVVPMMITPIVAALCWKLLLDPDHGVDQLLDRQPHRLARPTRHRTDLGDGGQPLAERALCRSVAARGAAFAAE